MTFIYVDWKAVQLWAVVQMLGDCAWRAVKESWEASWAAIKGGEVKEDSV